MSRNQALKSTLLLTAGALLFCRESDGPSVTGPKRTEDFPGGPAFVFGTVSDPRTGAAIPNLPVTLTPYDGASLAQELESAIQAEAPTNRFGEFAFSEIAAGTYVLFIRFDGGRLGYGEVVDLVRATPSPSELRISAPPIALDFLFPTDGGVISAADTAVLTFQGIKLQELLTLEPETRPLFARVDVYAGSGVGGGESGRIDPPERFEVGLDRASLEHGQVRLPLQVGGRAATLRLESFLGLELVYRDPGGGSPIQRIIRGNAISVVRR
jgi:hypothetical protein